MITQILTQIDWVSTAAGFTAGVVLYSVIDVLPRRKLKKTINEQQQQLSLLQSQFDNKAEQLSALQDEHELLEHSHQEQRDEAQHFKTRCSEQEKQSMQYNQFWQKAETEITQLRAQYNQRDVELNSMRTMLEQKQQSFTEQLAQIEESKNVLKKEFENLANKILDEKTQSFKVTNQESIEQLLKPVQGELKGFRDKMESIHVEDLKQRAQLKTCLLYTSPSPRDRG